MLDCLIKLTKRYGILFVKSCFNELIDMGFSWKLWPGVTTEASLSPATTMGLTSSGRQPEVIHLSLQTPPMVPTRAKPLQTSIGHTRAGESIRNAQF